MFPRISDLINYLFGTNLNIPIQSYGFMVALAFGAAAWILYLELKRMEHAGLISVRHKKVIKGTPITFQDVLFTFIFGFLLGWKGIGLITEYGLFSQDPQEYILSWSGNFLGGLIMAGGFTGYAYYIKRRKQLPKPVQEDVIVHPYQLTGNILLIAAIFGIIGSKIFDTLEHLGDLIRDPLETLFSFSGLSFYGGLIVAAFAVIWYANKHQIRFPFITDAAAPGLILAYAIGRIGCQLAGDGCWGVENPDPIPGWLSFLPDWIWSYRYPHNVLDEGVPIPGCQSAHCFILPTPVYPAPFYETLMGLIIFVILWGIRKRLKTPGYLFSIYLILNGIERFFAEQIRINKVYNFIGMKVTQAEMIAVVLIALGILGCWYFRWQYLKYKDKGQVG